MKKSVIFLITVILYFCMLGVSAAYASTSNCSGCHHIDFQTELITRPPVCSICHIPGHGELIPAGKIDSDFDQLHIYHHKGGSDAPTTDRKTGCYVCHGMNLTTSVRKLYCKLCHTNVSHENHGNVSASGWYTDGNGSNGPNTGYIQRTFSCINSKCHSTYGSLVTKPSCFNCHQDPHGEQRGPKDDIGVKINPNGTNPLTHSDITITWLFQTGDGLKKSLDGINWTVLDIGTAVVGSDFSFIDSGILNWTIVYYKVTRADGSDTYFPVYPPSSNAHINYLNNSRACALCHVTHSGDQAKLLKEQTTEDLCRTCHGLANTGSRYNVDTGEIVIAGSIDANGLITATSYIRSNSGAFGIRSGGKLYAGSNAWNGAEITSTHSTSSFVYNIAPGGGHNYLWLTCTNCHLSHPKKNAYRLLTIGNVEAYAVNPSATSERINYIRRMNIGCGCHRRYIVDQNSGHVISNSKYRHSVGVAIQGPFTSINPITLAPWVLSTTMSTEYKVYYNNQFEIAGTLSGSAPTQYVENGGVFCLTCHYAHGTTAMGNNPSAYDLNGDTLLNDSSTMLKRSSYDGACEDCHKR